MWIQELTQQELIRVSWQFVCTVLLLPGIQSASHVCISISFDRCELLKCHHNWTVMCNIHKHGIIFRLKYNIHSLNFSLAENGTNKLPVKVAVGWFFGPFNYAVVLNFKSFVDWFIFVITCILIDVSRVERSDFSQRKKLLMSICRFKNRIEMS